MKEPREIIKRPLITEKSSDIKEIDWFVFAVDRGANKKEIRQAIEKLFKVKVDKVRTVILPGKNVSRLGKAVGRRSALKKAYVKLKEGKIEFFQGV